MTTIYKSHTTNNHLSMKCIKSNRKPFTMPVRVYFLEHSWVYNMLTFLVVKLKVLPLPHNNGILQSFNAIKNIMTNWYISND